MAITGEPWRAEQALELGLLNYVVPREELDTKVDWLLERILDKSPAAIRLGKQALHAIQDMSLPETFQYTQLMIDRMAGTDDAREGFAAFREKRKPRWPGQ
jgi:enoyl-CoA hydratase/carnithine racemase